MARMSVLSLYAISIVLIGLNAGFFYTWSFTIMQSLGQIDAQHAIQAMQSINANIRTGWFAAIFFGAPFSLFVTGVLMLRSNRSAAVCALLAFVLAATTVIITFSLHVLMNNELATVESSAAAQSVWSDYSERWTNWNHARTITSILAFAVGLVGWSKLQTKRLN